MKCPYCGGVELKVIDSRDTEDAVRRRRRCLVCGHRFTTMERISLHDFYVIKKDGRHEIFNKEKLRTGVSKACEKRPLPVGAIDKLVDDIEAALYQIGKSEVPSSLIGDMVMDGLKGLDHIAYIRFASVYRQFTDITDLREEIDGLSFETPLEKGESSGR